MTHTEKRPRAFGGASLRALLERDITLAQLVALIHVAEHPGARVGHVAAVVGRSVPATGRLLESLVHGGLVVRTDDPRDRRARAVRLTAEGQRLVRGRRP